MFIVTMNKTKQLSPLIIFIMLFCLFSSSNLFAAEKNAPELERFKLNIGAFVPFFNSELRVDSRISGTGGDINLEDDLGLDENLALVRFDGYFRFFARHRLQLGYYDLSRSASKELLKNIDWGDTLFPEGLRVNTELNLAIYEVNYMYSFLQNDKLEIAAILGLDTLDIEASINGSLGLRSESSEAIGPVPVIGLDLTYKFTPSLHLTSRIQFFTLEFEEFDGTLIDFRAALEYMFFENFGLGVGYNLFDISVDIDDPDFLGKVDYEINGVQVYGVLRF